MAYRQNAYPSLMERTKDLAKRWDNCGLIEQNQIPTISEVKNLLSEAGYGEIYHYDSHQSARAWCPRKDVCNIYLSKNHSLVLLEDSAGITETHRYLHSNQCRINGLNIYFIPDAEDIINIIEGNIKRISLLDWVRNLDKKETVDGYRDVINGFIKDNGGFSTQSLVAAIEHALKE